MTERARIGEISQLILDHFDPIQYYVEFDTDTLAGDIRVHTNLGFHEEDIREGLEESLDESRAAIPDLQKEVEEQSPSTRVSSSDTPWPVPRKANAKDFYRPVRKWRSPVSIYYN